RKDSPNERWAAVGIGPLEVVAGHGLVDREDPDHSVVVFAEVAFGLLGRPVSGDWGDRKETLLATVEGTWPVEHRAAEGTQEDRRPADLEGLLGQPDEILQAAEVLDPEEL